jgi:hypothetical protein
MNRSSSDWVAEETLLAICGQDYAVRGVMELDLTYSGASIEKRDERNACASIAIPVDAEIAGRHLRTDQLLDLPLDDLPSIGPTAMHRGGRYV